MVQDGGGEGEEDKKEEEEEEEEEEGFGTCLSSQLELGFRRSTDLEPPGGISRVYPGVGAVNTLP